MKELLEEIKLLEEVKEMLQHNERCYKDKENYKKEYYNTVKQLQAINRIIAKIEKEVK